ncbi:MAG: bifunctional diaminohydroxyphosphoribosylaminopyrimidine deaminase/5-amino-6-(5-phosphoribosylamino)uracil reductase RibD [Bacteroidota bacterium]
MDLSDHSYLYRCIELARKARRDVYPNPYVGAVIVHEGKIIGEGFHQKSGEGHAEVNAIHSVKDKKLLPFSTIYVSLEPCSHYGKTPPCSQLILNYRIPRVVIGVKDPNPKVDGGGISLLRDRGVEVEIAEDPWPFIELNKVFWTNQLKKRPFVVLKWAESKDGFLAGLDEKGNPFPVKITDKTQNRLVHHLRAYHHSILVGRRTASIDNPSLTTRHFPGRSPLRLVFDPKLMLAEDLNIFTDGRDTIIVNEKKSADEGVMKYAQLDVRNGLEAALSSLYKDHGICSILVEGGKETLEAFIDQGIYDEVYVFKGKDEIGDGLPSPSHQLQLDSMNQEYSFGSFYSF